MSYGEFIKNYTIYNPSKFDSINVKKAGAIGDGIVDDTAAIQRALDSSLSVYFPPGVYLVTNLITRDGHNFFGDGKKSIIKFKTGATGWLFAATTQSVSYEDLDIDGDESVDYTGVTTAGVRSGIQLSGVNPNTRLTRVSVHGFNNYGIGCHGIGSQAGYISPISVTDIASYQNYIGFDTGIGGENVAVTTTSEYMRISGLNCYMNRYGLVINAGNETITNSHLDANAYGLTINAAFNNGHGTITGSTINHNTLLSLNINGVTNGFSIVGNQMFFGDISVINSKGINIQGNNLHISNITLTDNGTSFLKGNYFVSDISLTKSNDNFVISDNFYGSTPTFISNNKDLITNNKLTFDLSTYELALQGKLSITGNQQITGRIGINYDPAYQYAPKGLHVYDQNTFSGTSSANSIPVCANVAIMSNSAPGLDVGGVLGLGGNFKNTAQPYSGVVFGGLKGAKANNTDNNFDGYLGFYTNLSATIREVGRFNENGTLCVGVITPSVSAIVDITSTVKGFLKPRMTTTQRDAITSPSEGLEIYNLTAHKMQFYNGSAWETITSAVL